MYKTFLYFPDPQAQYRPGREKGCFDAPHSQLVPLCGRIRPARGRLEDYESLEKGKLIIINQEGPSQLTGIAVAYMPSKEKEQYETTPDGKLSHRLPFCGQ